MNETCSVVLPSGVYHVSFDSSQPSFGEGILVIRDNQLHGGDVGFVYRGGQTPEGIRVHISQHDPSVPSVLGMTRAYDLILSGRRAGALPAGRRCGPATRASPACQCATTVAPAAGE